MAIPILAADLVGDELVGGVGVGDAQQRLGEAHEHHALFGGERVFLHEGIDAALLARPALTAATSWRANSWVWRALSW